MINKKRWRGSVYLRGGQIHDKWKNIKKERITYRDTNSSAVYSEQGKLLGFEENHKHNYGADIKKKKPKGWHGQSYLHSLARKGIKIRRL